MLKYVVPALIIACVPLSASAQRASQQQQNAHEISTPSFVRKAAAGDLFEIRSSQLALTRSKDNRVRSFARRLVTDHRKAARQMQNTLHRAGMRQPPQRMDARQQSTLAQLRRTGPRNFDNAFVDAQIEAHQGAVKMYQAYARDGRRPELRQFAQRELPTLQEHLAIALRLGPRVAQR